LVAINPLSEQFTTPDCSKTTQRTIEMNLTVVLLAVVIVGISIAGIAIKMFMVKDGEFRKVCGSVDPKTGKPIPCSCKSPEPYSTESCDNTAGE